MNLEAWGQTEGQLRLPGMTLTVGAPFPDEEVSMRRISATHSPKFFHFLNPLMWGQWGQWGQRGQLRSMPPHPPSLLQFTPQPSASQRATWKGRHFVVSSLQPLLTSPTLGSIPNAEFKILSEFLQG